MKQSRDPDHLLASEGFPEVNAEFYAASPLPYFRFRIESILLATGCRPELNELLRAGVVAGDLRVTRAAAAEDTDADYQGAVVADSAVLFHHISETLVRLFLAHRHSSRCPPLEIARERRPGFGKRVRRDILDAPEADLLSEVGWAFLGLSTQGDLDERSTSHVETFAGWLKYFAGHWLADAPLYNSAKHGFAVSSGEGEVQFGDPQTDDFTIDRSGPSISYLESKRDAAGQMRWHRTMQFVSPERFLSGAHMATIMLDQLWRLAAWRYAGHELGQLHTLGSTVAEVEQRLEAKLDGPFILQVISQQLDYYLDDAQ